MDNEAQLSPQALTFHNSPPKPHSPYYTKEWGFGVGWRVGTYRLYSHIGVSTTLDTLFMLR